MLHPAAFLLIKAKFPFFLINYLNFRVILSWFKCFTYIKHHSMHAAIALYFFIARFHDIFCQGWIPAIDIVFNFINIS